MAKIVWQPQPGPQLSATVCPADEIFFGGSRGGGKTDCAIGMQCDGAMQYGHEWNGLFLRKNFKHFQELRRRIDELIRAGMPAIRVGGDMHTNTIKFANGAKITLTAIEREEQLEFFQGQQFQLVSIEEATHFPFILSMIDKLKACLRSPHGVPCQMFLTGNPGGPGHTAIKARYIDAGPAKTIMVDPTGETRCFIPSSVEDNKILCTNDPKYVRRLRAISDPALRRAWLEGDWDVVMGGFFDDVWRRDTHMLPYFQPPDHWPRMMGFDWGSARPFSIGWYCVSGGEVLSELGRKLPRGALIRYAEWYGCEAVEMSPGIFSKHEVIPNKGIRKPSVDVALEILEREKARGEDSKRMDRIADPAVFASQDGPPISEKMALKGVIFRPGDNKRVPGWEECRSRLKGDEDEGPRFYVTENCTHFLRTVPTLERDDRNWEDIDCFVAGTMVSTPYGGEPIENICIGQLVNTPIGPRTVLKSYCSGTAQTVTVKLSNGDSVTGTLTHKILTKEHGLLPLCMLSSGDILISEEDTSWLQKLCSKVLSSLSVTTADIVNATRKMEVFLAQPYCIGWCGRLSMGKSLLGMTSTTETMTPVITALRTWNSALRVIMLDTITKNAYMPVTISAGLWLSGARVMKGKKFFEKTLLSAARILPNENLRALIVANLLHRNTQELSSVPTVVKRWVTGLKLLARFVAPYFGRSTTTQKELKPAVLSVVGCCVNENEEYVYNVTVDQAHLYYANGLVSSNTDTEDHVADEWRYMMMSRQGKGINETELPKTKTMEEKDWDRLTDSGSDFESGAFNIGE